MRSNSSNKALAVIASILLCGCAAPAPDLPRHTSATQEPGYATPAAASLASAGAPVADPTVSTPPQSVKSTALVSKPVWMLLQADERQRIEGSYDVKVLGPEAFGTVIDVQGADQSTAGTSGGAMLGAAIGSAAYIDRAFSGGNSYSAGANLAVGLLGAVLGSAFDRPAESKFQFRYTVKQGDGEIQYFDEVKTTGFRHSVGVCVMLPNLALVSQHVCQQTPETLRARYIAEAN